MTKIQLAGAATAVLMSASLGACNPPPNAASAAKPAVDTGKIATAVKADQAQFTADFNAHDAAKVVSHDAPDIAGMFHGQPNAIGAAADLTITKKFFTDAPDAHFSVADETVDVAASGDMAVYRASYTLTVTDPKSKKPVTETGNFVSGYRPQADGSWKMAWSIGADTPSAAKE